jgi:hypothetical protein
MFSKKPVLYKAMFAMENGHPEIKDSEIIVTSIDGKITVGVKAMYYEYTRNDDGSFGVNPSQVGDYRIVDKNSTVEEFFGSLKAVLEGVSEALKEAEAGRKLGDKA